MTSFLTNCVLKLTFLLFYNDYAVKKTLFNYFKISLLPLLSPSLSLFYTYKTLSVIKFITHTHTFKLFWFVNICNEMVRFSYTWEIMCFFFVCSCCCRFLFNCKSKSRSLYDRKNVGMVLMMLKFIFFVIELRYRFLFYFIFFCCCC